jgi:hypothetical protein
MAAMVRAFKDCIRLALFHSRAWLETELLICLFEGLRIASKLRKDRCQPLLDPPLCEFLVDRCSGASFRKRRVMRRNKPEVLTAG